MPRSKTSLPQYLSFTRKERTGIISIAILTGLFILLPFLFPFFIKRDKIDPAAFEEEIAQLKIKQDSGGGYASTGRNNEYNDQYAQPADKPLYGKQFSGELFYFDPNSLPVDGWKKLGIKERTATTIQKYISKGGRFYKPGDIAKIWGLQEEEINRLLPYVRIENNQQLKNNNEPAAKRYEKPGNSMAIIDINIADTAAFIALPGIGSKLAARIITFREKLGGFYKVEQVAETYGLPDSTFQKIKGKLVVTASTVKKLNINTATVDEMKLHPYLRYNIANAIVQYRTQHGNFSAVAEIKKIMLVTEEIFTRSQPYLTIK